MERGKQEKLHKDLYIKDMTFESVFREMGNQEKLDKDWYTKDIVTFETVLGILH